MQSGRVSLNFQIDYQLFNRKMLDFYDKHADEIRDIMGQCFKVEEPDAGERLREINGPIMTESIPEDPLGSLFGGKK